MNFNALATQRYSCRQYKAEPVPVELITDVIHTASLAPSAVNYQPWHVIVANTPHKIAQIASAYHRDWFIKAPVVLVVCANTHQAWVRSTDNKNHAEIDTAIFIDHITLAAADAGLGTCWVCNFNPDILCSLLNLPLHIIPVALIPMGYPYHELLPEKKRKDIKQIIIWENDLANHKF
jgi:nitroreductase